MSNALPYARAYGRASSRGSAGYARASARAGVSRGGVAAGYRGARYVPTSVAEQLPVYDEPAISVVPGAGRRAQVQEGLSAAALTVAKVCAVACIVLALIAVARVYLTSASAECALETRQIEKNIEAARSEGSELEVSLSVLSNPTRIKTQAQALGMVAPAPEFSEQITLPEDVVVTDEDGALSLSGSVAALASE